MMIIIKKSTLLGIPLELRLHILRYLCVSRSITYKEDPRPYSLRASSDMRKKMGTVIEAPSSVIRNLYLICRQMKVELLTSNLDLTVTVHRIRTIDLVVGFSVAEELDGHRLLPPLGLERVDELYIHVREESIYTLLKHLNGLDYHQLVSRYIGFRASHVGARLPLLGNVTIKRLPTDLLAMLSSRGLTPLQCQPPWPLYTFDTRCHGSDLTTSSIKPSKTSSKVCFGHFRSAQVERSALAELAGATGELSTGSCIACCCNCGVANQDDFYTSGYEDGRLDEELAESEMKGR